MKDRIPLRFRFLLSYLLFFIPIVIFTLIIFSTISTQNNLMVEENSLKLFTYTAESFSSLLTRLEDIAKLPIIGEKIRNERDFTKMGLEKPESSVLTDMQSRFSFQDIDLIVFFRDDNSVYSTHGYQQFWEWEKTYTHIYNFRISQTFTHIFTCKDAGCYPIYSSDDSGVISGLLVCYPVTGDPDMTMAIIIPAVTWKEIFRNYMGDVTADYYLYNNTGKLLFSFTDGKNYYTSFHQMLKQYGMGCRTFHTENGDLILLRTEIPNRGIVLSMVQQKDQFYSNHGQYKPAFVILLIILFTVLIALAFILTRSSYKPIRELKDHVATDESTDDLEAIRDSFDKRIAENEMLTGHLSELTPLIMRQFAENLIFSRFSSQQSLVDMSLSAGQPFIHPNHSAIYIQLLANQIDDINIADVSVLISNRLSSSSCSVVSHELPQENAISVFLSFKDDKKGNKDYLTDKATRIQQLLEKTYGFSLRLGIGGCYQDPLLLSRAFAEARIGLVLHPDTEQTCFYSPDAVPDEAYYIGIPDSLLDLLIDSIHRGEKESSLLVFDETIREMTKSMNSMIYFRFKSGEIVSRLLRLANQEKITYEASNADDLINFRTPQEFFEKGRLFITNLCSAFQNRNSEDSLLFRSNIMTYIRENYCRYDLSISVMAKELSISKSSISTAIHELTGQNFAQYISFLRLNEFRRLLSETDMQIKDFVTAVGYSDVTTVIRKFKSIEGITPGQYRIQARNQ